MFLGVKFGAILTPCRPDNFGVTRGLTNARRSCIYGLVGGLSAPLILPVRLRFFMRTALVLLVLLLGACAEGTYSSPVDGRLMTRIDRSYAARDACLSRNAGADDISNSDPATLARAIALACAPETQKLVDVSNRDGDPRAAAAIRKDSEFRAMGYVLKARGQVTN